MKNGVMLVLLGLLVFGGLAFAHPGHGGRHAQTLHAAPQAAVMDEDVQEALEGGDYDAWKTAVEENDEDAAILEVINEDNSTTMLKCTAWWKRRGTLLNKQGTLRKNSGLSPGCADFSFLLSGRRAEPSHMLHPFLHKRMGAYVAPVPERAADALRGILGFFFGIFERVVYPYYGHGARIRGVYLPVPAINRSVVTFCPCIPDFLLVRPYFTVRYGLIRIACRDQVFYNSALF